MGGGMGELMSVAKMDRSLFWWLDEVGCMLSIPVDMGIFDRVFSDILLLITISYPRFFRVFPTSSAELVRLNPRSKQFQLSQSGAKAQRPRSHEILPFKKLAWHWHFGIAPENGCLEKDWFPFGGVFSPRFRCRLFVSFRDLDPLPPQVHMELLDKLAGLPRYLVPMRPLKFLTTSPLGLFEFQKEDYIEFLNIHISYNIHTYFEWI